MLTFQNDSPAAACCRSFLRMPPQPSNESVAAMLPTDGQITALGMYVKGRICTSRSYTGWLSSPQLQDDRADGQSNSAERSLGDWSVFEQEGKGMSGGARRSGAACVMTGCIPCNCGDHSQLG